MPQAQNTPQMIRIRTWTGPAYRWARTEPTALPRLSLPRLPLVPVQQEMCIRDSLAGAADDEAFPVPGQLASGNAGFFIIILEVG